MMNFDKIMKKKEVLKILHGVLEQNETKTKLSVFSPHGEKYGYNQYSLLIIMDSLIKYCIVIDDLELLSPYLEELEKISKNYTNHKELVYWCNELLAEMIRLKLGLSNKTSKTNKKQILKFLYDQYIVNGFAFHSFPSCLKNKVRKNGFDPKNSQIPMNEMKQIYYIFKNHNFNDILPKDFMKSPSYITLTDSPAMAYYYSFSSPMYFCELAATGKYMKDDQVYDREAYYRKDQQACCNNLKQFSEHIQMTEKEENSVLSSFLRQWEMFDISNSYSCIAFIERKKIGKNKLNDIDLILKRSAEEDIVIGISRITDSRYACIKRYSPLLPISFCIRKVPSYYEVKNNFFKRKDEKISSITSEEIVDNNKEEKLKKKTGHSCARIFGLLGILLILLGFVLFMIFHFYGIGGV